MRQVITVDMGGTHLRGALMSKEPKILSLKKIETDGKSGSDKIIHKLIELTKSLRAPKVSAVVVGCPGPLDPEKGILYELPNLPHWKDVPLKKILEEKCDLPVWIENDANLAALGEVTYGCGQGTKSFVQLTLGTGLGSGMILNGQIWRGATGVASEWGHTVIDAEGRLCHCGNRGCAETEVSATALVTKAKMLINEKNLTSEWLYHQAIQSNPVCIELFKNFGRKLGILCANIANAINPQMIVLSGGVSQAHSIFLEETISETQKRAFSSATKNLQIKISKLGDDAGLWGGLALAVGRKS